MSNPKLCIIGLDCADPHLVFERWLPYMPNLRRLTQRGVWGPLTSTIPAITVPAWMCMATSQDPGQLGFYGFRNRKDHSYDGLTFANALAVKAAPVWDTLGEAGKKVAVVAVPPSYPPRRVNGHLISCFLTPDTTADYTYPASLKAELEEKFGEYILDVKDFRTDDADYLIKQVWRMTENRFDVVRWLAREKEWDFLWFVEMGPDRLHHAMWKYFDAAHPNFMANPRYADGLRQYYVYLDKKIGELLHQLPPECHVMVVSDHGIQPMDGGFCFNDWLITEGYLVLKEPPTKPTKFKYDLVDWEKTRAWGDGGYYGRCFMNVRGREPRGTIAPEDYERARSELKRKLEALTDEHGRNIDTRAFRPEDLYQNVGGVAPDLIVYFGNLAWRSIGTVGNSTLWVHQNDTGPDDANHSQTAMFIWAGPGAPTGWRGDLSIYDVAPTALSVFGVAPSTSMVGKVIR